MKGLSVDSIVESIKTKNGNFLVKFGNNVAYFDKNFEILNEVSCDKWNWAVSCWDEKVAFSTLEDTPFPVKSIGSASKEAEELFERIEEIGFKIKGESPVSWMYMSGTTVVNRDLDFSDIEYSDIEHSYANYDEIFERHIDVSPEYYHEYSCYKDRSFDNDGFDAFKTTSIKKEYKGEIYTLSIYSSSRTDNIYDPRNWFWKTEINITKNNKK